MKSRNALITALALGLGLTAPAFAQDASTDPASTDPTQPQSTSPTDAATQTPPTTQPTDPATAQTTSPSAPAAQPQGEARQVTWSDLDTDQDGKLTKTEASPVQALTQVFDDADADKDGALTPDEYKAFVAQNQTDAASSQPPGSAQPPGSTQPPGGG